jgi:hypothetical protein
MAENAPVFAILGHPNEGKSSVVATLAEDDSVRISPTPGETRKCRDYPVVIDGREVIRFVDTPGFQQPRRTLAWIQAYSGPPRQRVEAFIAAHRDDPDFADECELLAPVAEGAGILFVADGSRPVRAGDAAEMEILRLTAAPRMAVINPKEKSESRYLEDWKTEARSHFNTIRIFDAQQAAYPQRIALLETLAGIDPDWEPPLRRVIGAFQEDRERRLRETAAVICELVESAAGHSVKKSVPNEADPAKIREELAGRFRKEIAEMEKNAHERIRKRFRHNLFSLSLPPQSILNEDLFSSRTWRLLGLRPWQLAAAAAAGGGLAGAKVDLALAGLSFGFFTALGGAAGAGAAAIGSKRMAGAKWRGFSLGRTKARVGPVRSDQLLFVLIDRALLYAAEVANRSHSRRDPPGRAPVPEEKAGYTANWGARRRRSAAGFFSAVRKGRTESAEALRGRLTEALYKELRKIADPG